MFFNNKSSGENYVNIQEEEAVSKEGQQQG